MSFVYYLKPSSFCFWVKRSVEELIKIIDTHVGENIYCIHALVHNPKITNYFIQRGIFFVENIDEVLDKNAIVVFSAHGITRKIFEQAQDSFKKVYNLECPFVSKIYNEISWYMGQWIYSFVYIGKEWHQEAKNVVDHIIYKGGKVFTLMNMEDISRIPFSDSFAILSQTTLNFAMIQVLITKIQEQFPLAIVPKVSDICKATYERQGVIKKFHSVFDTLVVIWGKESSNTKELCLIGKELGKQVFFWESLWDLLENQDFLWQNIVHVAVTWWASTPIEDILDVLDWYKKKWYEEKILDFWEII
jgi:4-hydroxy-3-methylbut-2-en-1-yl diphosphate reductase